MCRSLGSEAPWPGTLHAVAEGPVWRKPSLFGAGEAGGPGWRPGRGHPQCQEHVLPGGSHAPWGRPLQPGCRGPGPPCASQVCVPRRVRRDAPTCVVLAGPPPLTLVSARNWGAHGETPGRSPLTRSLEPGARRAVGTHRQDTMGFSSCARGCRSRGPEGKIVTLSPPCADPALGHAVKTTSPGPHLGRRHFSRLVWGKRGAAGQWPLDPASTSNMF